MAKMGRPKKDIDPDKFEKLCSIMCTEEEIAGFFDCSIDTINNFCKNQYGMTFSDAFKKYSAKGKMSLRRIQFKLAETNASMAIFLGKNYLGQTDKAEFEIGKTKAETELTKAKTAELNNGGLNADIEDLTALAELLNDTNTND